jgi:NAD(P)-dependent dehydrogenase (short-subunit alcohol dehydrogenase family)
VIPVKTDVTVEAECKYALSINNTMCRNLIDQAILHFGRIDVLVLNAGVSSHFLFEDNEDLSVFKKMMDINFFGYLYPTK